MPDLDAPTVEMANVIATALGVNDLAVAAEDPPRETPAAEPAKATVEKPEPETPPVVTPPADAPASALEQTQRQLAALSESMNQLVSNLSAEQTRRGEAMPKTPGELEKLSKDPNATEEARLVAGEMLAIKESLKGIERNLESQIQDRYDRDYEAEMAAFQTRYPRFSDAEIVAIDKAFEAAVEKRPELADTLTFEEFAVRHFGGYEPLLARRAQPTPRKDEPLVPGGKPPAKVVTESATGGGRKSLGKPLDRHATQDDVAARLTASLEATR